MGELDRLVERNGRLAARQASDGTLMPSLPAALPKVRAIVIGCADMRVDPVYVLGIEPGEAVVMRNIGGRITPGLLEQLGLLGRIGQVADEIPGGGGEFDLIVLHHTDCGMKRLAGDPDLLCAYFGVDESELAAKSVSDPREAVSVDVALLKSQSALPATWLLSGLVCDVATGKVDVVVGPEPIRAST